MNDTQSACQLDKVSLIALSLSSVTIAIAIGGLISYKVEVINVCILDDILGIVAQGCSRLSVEGRTIDST